ncbi:MAG: energy transducer TonB [Pseudomonadota bacterium]
MVQLVEIETLDSPAPGPDPAASSAQLVTRPGPANSGGLGDPMSGGTRGVRLIRKVPAVYPSSSMQRGEAGVVQINARIDERGRVAEIKLLRSSGHELLDSAAIRAVGKWKFEPALENDRPVSVWHPINLVMSVYNKKYCRIRDEPVDAMVGDEVVEGATVFLPLGGDAALRKIIDDLDSSRSGAAAQIRALIDDWGPVLSIRPVVDAGIQGWVKREILPGSPQGNTGGVVQVRSDTYLVQHEKIVARWRVDTDPSGEVWCIHVGPAPRGN